MSKSEVAMTISKKKSPSANTGMPDAKTGKKFIRRLPTPTKNKTAPLASGKKGGIFY
jgi:hypothetical protein